MLINLLKIALTVSQGKKFCTWEGVGFPRAKGVNFWHPPTTQSRAIAADFRRRIFRRDTFCKVFAGSPPHLSRHPPAERYGHTPHPLAKPHNRTAGIDIGHAIARIRAGSSIHDRAYVFPPSLADASRRVCFVQQVGAVKPFALIDPYKFLPHAKRPSEHDSDGLIHVFFD